MGGTAEPASPFEPPVPPVPDPVPVLLPVDVPVGPVEELSELPHAAETAIASTAKVADPFMSGIVPEMRASGQQRTDAHGRC